jgi:alpha-L-rhamnosidase
MSAHPMTSDETRSERQGSADRPGPAPARRVPWGLRVEHLETVAGLTERRPRLSWRLPDNRRGQVSAQVEITVNGSTSTYDVAGGRHVLVPWPGEPLPSRARVSWRVRVTTQDGENHWSEPATFSTGLDRADWAAAWIGPAEPSVAEAGNRPAHLLRRVFSLGPGIRRATAYATAHGIYELFVNGTRIGDAELTPGYTSYRKYLHVQTYDVTKYLRDGENAVGAVLSDGWFRGRTGFFRTPDCFGDETAFLCQLEIEQGDGQLSTVATDDDWTWSTGSIVAADLMDGQRIDFTRAKPDWSTGAGNGFAPVVVRTGAVYETPSLISSPAPPVRTVEWLPARTITTLDDGRVIADFGQNSNGWVRITGLSDEQVTIEHAEALDPDGTGNITNDHLRSVDLGGGHAPVGMTDSVIASAPGDLGLNDGEVQFRHTTNGFQYVRLSGDVSRLTREQLSAAVVHTDLRRTGWFACSDDRVNRLHELAVWSFRGNACDIPTDCPHRERAGWTGDYQLYVPTAAYLYDVAGFTEKWLQGVIADQRDNGVILNFSPDPHAAPGNVDVEPEPWDRNQGSAGWCEAIIIVPWQMYLSYGDRKALSDCYPAMTRWHDYCRRQAETKRHPTVEERRPEPAAHDRYLWDTGYHWGEWLEAGETATPHDPPEGEGIVATAYYYWGTHLLAKIAGTLGHDDDACRFAELAARIAAAWRTEYLQADGRLARDTQSTYARALTFGLIPKDQRAVAADRLVQLVRDAGTHLSTGFLSTPMLLPALADTGHPDVAFDLLAADTEPSWMVMIDRGATTIWESWDGLSANGEPKHSLNHYSKGAVISFLHTHVAGLRQAEGSVAYRDFVVQPLIGGGLTWAEATLDTPHGRIESQWRLADDKVTIEVTVPSGTQAEVRLPSGAHHHVGVGRHRFCEPWSSRPGATSLA